MVPSKNVEKFLENLEEEEDESDLSAAKADARSQKIYERIHEITLIRDELKQILETSKDVAARSEIQVRLVHLEREFNDLLNVLSLDAMEEQTHGPGERR